MASVAVATIAAPTIIRLLGLDLKNTLLVLVEKVTKISDRADSTNHPVLKSCGPAPFGSLVLHCILMLNVVPATKPSSLIANKEISG